MATPNLVLFEDVKLRRIRHDVMVRWDQMPVVLEWHEIHVFPKALEIPYVDVSAPTFRDGNMRTLDDAIHSRNDRIVLLLTMIPPLFLSNSQSDKHPRPVMCSPREILKR